MRQPIYEDLYRYEGESAKKLSVRLKYFFFVPGYTMVHCYRMASTSNNFFLKAFWRVLHRITMYITGIQIPVETKIGKGFRIVHFGTIVVNPNAVIGDNFNLSQGTLIGNSQGRRAGFPKIGNNVCMQANSIIVGGVTIGNNVFIAPGAFVNFDVPDNCLVIGNPGRIIQRDYSPTEEYIVYPV